MSLICITAIGLIAAYLLDAASSSTPPSDHPRTGELT